jgi:hypothetical protein
MSKDWKDSLLSSGIPLEQSLRQTLINLGITFVSEYAYERLNEEGINTIFSIDNYGKYYPNFKDKHKDKLCVEYFIEAKYATDNKNWIFTPEEFPTILTLQEAYIVLDSLVEKIKLKTVNVSKENQEYFCGKGIVIDNKGAERYEIRRGVQQLRYALVNRTLEVTKKQLFGLEDDREVISVLVPILVTTAKLWRIETGLSIEDIRNSKDLHEVAKEREYLLLFEPPDNQMIRYSLSLVDDMIREELKGELTLLLKKIVPRLSNPYFTNYIEYFYTSMPRVFLVCNYNYFHKTISKSTSFFQQKNLFVTK